MPDRPAESGLLALPPEILLEIVEHLRGDKWALKCLALTNSVCRHLARQIQFAEVRLEDDARSIQIVFQLAAEVLLSLNGNNKAGIGTYIRRFAVIRFDKRDGLHPICRGDIMLKERLKQTLAEHDDPTGNQKELLEARAVCKAMLGMSHKSVSVPCVLDWNDRHVVSRAIIMAVRFAMPDLVALEWQDHTLGQDLIPGLTECIYQVQELTLNIPGSDLTHIKLEPEQLRLRSLALFSSWDGGVIFDDEDRGASVARLRHYKQSLTAMLRACAPQLRRLTLGMGADHPARPFRRPLDPPPPVVDFPNLRFLRLDRIDYVEDIWDLFRSPVRDLDLDERRLDWSVYPLSAGLGQLPALETFYMPHLVDHEIPEALNFLYEHKGTITGIKFGYQVSKTYEQHVIPLLSAPGSDAFEVLSSLLLTWYFAPEERQWHHRVSTHQVPEASLRAIGKIQSLERLILANDSADLAGVCAWKVDLDAMREWLSGLKRLKLLSLSGDTYADRFDEETYYSHYPITSIQQKDFTMTGTLRDMVELRARPDLDVADEWYIWEKFRGMDVWHFDGDIEKQDLSERIGPLRDRYCHIVEPEKSWFLIVFRNFLLGQAEKYAAVLPKLERVNFGHLPMDIRLSAPAGVPRRPRAFPLSGCRPRIPYEVLQFTRRIDVDDRFWNI